MKRKALIHGLDEINDVRMANSGTLRDFWEILVISNCAMSSGAESVEDITLQGSVKQVWFKGFLALKNRIPSPDTFDSIQGHLTPKQLHRTLRGWSRYVVTTLGGQFAIDGKTQGNSADDSPQVGMVSAITTDAGIALGLKALIDKRNEITVNGASNGPQPHSLQGRNRADLRTNESPHGEWLEV